MPATTTFDRLDELRSTVRARCVEDCEYFVHRVFGHRASLADHAELWNCVVQGRRAPHGVVLSETFEWLFPELAQRSSQRAA